MKTNLDIKGALLGLCLGVLSMLAVAATTTGSAGRFQIASGGAYALIIDTTTGKVWSAQFTSTSQIKPTDVDFYDVKLK